MKDKTNSMNSGGSVGAGAEKGYVRIPNSEMASRRDRKERQLKWANLDDNKALLDYENFSGADDDHIGDGFLPRNNYEDRS